MPSLGKNVGDAPTKQRAAFASGRSRRSAARADADHAVLSTPTTPAGTPDSAAR